MRGRSTSGSSGSPTIRAPIRRSRITTQVPVADYFARPGRGAARPTRPRSTRIRTGSRCRTTWRREVWGTEDYELARSLVDTPLPEDDLFAGVRERVTQ